MFRKTMIALFAVASVSMLAPDVAAARGGFSGGGGGGGGGRGGGSFGGSFSGGRAGGIGGASFGAARIGGSAFQGGSVSNSFARSTATGPAGVQGNRFAGSGFRHDHGGFRHHHGRNFFVGGYFGPGYYDDYYDYPYYVADDSYYYDGGCYVVQRRVHTRYGWRLRPVQVCG